MSDSFKNVYGVLSIQISGPASLCLLFVIEIFDHCENTVEFSLIQ